MYFVVVLESVAYIKPLYQKSLMPNNIFSTPPQYSMTVRRSLNSGVFGKGRNCVYGRKEIYLEHNDKR